MTPRKLLFLSHRLPFPPHNGAAIRTFNILRLLSRKYEITGLCFDRSDRATERLPPAERIHGLAGFGRFRAFAIPQQRSRRRLLWDHIRSVATVRPYTHFVHDSMAFEDALGSILAQQSFDLIHVDSLDLVRYLERLPLDRVVLTHHNTESTLLQRRAEAEGVPLRRSYLRFQAKLLQVAERQWVPRVGLNVVVSRQDAAELARLAGGGRFAVVPNGVDVEFFKPAEGVGEGLAFVGGTSYFPNLDALRWFHGAILPELRKRGCTPKTTFVGRATAEEINRYSGPNGVSLTGYVDDIRPFVGSAACFIAPLRTGGGTRLKIVDAWAMGKAVVATTIGAEGLAAQDGDNILLRDTPDSFADAVVRVLTDANLRRRLEIGARRTAETLYSWEGIAQTMVEAYESTQHRASSLGATTDRLE